MLLKELYASFHSFHIIVEFLTGFSRSSSSRASDCHLHARGVSGPIYDQGRQVIYAFLGQASMKIRQDTKEQSVRSLVLSYSLYVKLSSTRPRRRSVDVCWPRYHPCRDACPRQRKTRSSGTSTLGWPPKTGWILSDSNEHILID